MFVLNTTFHVDKSVEEDFFLWLKSRYLPVATLSGLFASSSVMRLMLEVEEGFSGFALGMRTSDIEAAVEWYDSVGERLRTELTEKFGERLVYFTTCMEEIEI